MTFNIKIETENFILHKSDLKVHARNVPLSFIFMDGDLTAPQIHRDSTRIFLVFRDGNGTTVIMMPMI